jgi:hypothetical protein
LFESTANPMRRGLVLGTGAAIAAAFVGPMAAMAKRVEYRGGCAAGAASPSVDSPYGPTARVNDRTTGLPLIEFRSASAMRATAGPATSCRTA